MAFVDTVSNVTCSCSNGATNSGIEVWVPAIISIITLAVNMGFYIYIQPKISDHASAISDLKKVSTNLLNYLADIVSYTDFDGVPTKIRKYSLQIHLCFKSGIADPQIEELLETIFQMAKKRKGLSSEDQIKVWNEEFKGKVHELRIELAKYCGSLEGISKKERRSN